MTNNIENPVQKIWIFKMPFYHFLHGFPFLLVCIFGFSYFSSKLLPLAIIICVVLYEVGMVWGDLTRWKNFKMHIIDNGLSIQQYSEPASFISLGIKMKPQIHIPYNKIENIYTNRGLFDRLFGLESVIIEFIPGNEEDNKTYIDTLGRIGRRTRWSGKEILGFLGNRVHIPGIKKLVAEEIKMLKNKRGV